MNLRVLDASVLLASEDPDDEHHEHAVRLLTGPDPLATLDLAYYEVTNVAVRVWRDRAAADRLRERIVALGGDGGLIRADAPLLSSAAAIAEKHGISAYDAAYVAGARRSESQLVS
ncbi:MAG: type II toxin-antitoxin system VapC family toxin, partial [Acidimicrobiales bacterium]